MRILGAICARGGSKGVKSKNTRLLNGKPLIAYTIETLLKWGKADRVVVSTDSHEIMKVANDYGAETPFERPAELASDTAAKIPVIQHLLQYCEKEENSKYDVIVDLDPTAPLRKTSDIDNALKEFERTRAEVLYSVTESAKNPYFNMVELDEDGRAHLSKELKGEFFRRQDAPKVYSINGSIYIYKRDFLEKAQGLHSKNSRIFVMNDLSSIDIDREIDFQYIEFLLESGIFEFD
ncbi:MAG: acylneuraminate cytidylyltransferase family protein [Candidatus Thorarchaeota archaeon]|jgi:CMP-N-acetylneuraminic acid synthetase